MLSARFEPKIMANVVIFADIGKVWVFLVVFMFYGGCASPHPRLHLSHLAKYKTLCISALWQVRAPLWRHALSINTYISAYYILRQPLYPNQLSHKALHGGAWSPQVLP